MLVQALAAVVAASGWRTGLRAAAGVCLAAAPLCALLVRASPEACGQLPDGGTGGGGGGGDGSDAAPAEPDDAAARQQPQPGGVAQPPPLLEGCTRAQALATPLFWSWAAFTFAYFIIGSGERSTSLLAPECCVCGGGWGRGGVRGVVVV